MASEAQNSPFIKNMASSDKKTRDQALTSLRAYLAAQTQISPLDLLKLWKGLFYCLYMQDKPAQQQRLSRDLASLVSTLRPDVVLPFLGAFWTTMAREWGNIDTHRMNKYLYLIRQYVHASFAWVARGGWKEGVVGSHGRVLEEGPLSAGDVKVPDGLRYHVLDVFVDEVERVGVEGVEIESVLAPVEKLAREGRVKSLRKAAEEVLGDERVRRWRGESVDEVGDGSEGDEEEWGGIQD
ncbi:hypothetical protein EJ04DRAFT_483391 [Polyplosphaeria fusca]|uniref:Uncharacterized protein n=1 Tax=Polyplosphaeria fusca TaxID=682080 RepID=A0A9P4R894_9PLEO|nr:hypothetical protein EJ04DRAFT_483391 [Polyplosphaeria fusca]